ncbi:SufS family cysteine desulfurase [Peptoniphilus catoniae]|uniref:SufS family cysteine desulfurase n=1 Tax=Peptoniphilus catoniae TaxID=1660341 RepID=UPI0010FD9FCE|nr:SufS family cysteine desulfurase [Peptoniphilus catoniae]
MLDKKTVEKIRSDFKFLEEDDNYIYFDNGATTQRPIQVIEKTADFYKKYNGNPHRGAHFFAIKSTEFYEEGREKISKFIGANSSNEIIFVRNASEALNLVAYSWGLNNLKPGDEILLSIMEHHSNLVPWQIVAEKTGAKLKFLYLNKDRQIEDKDFEDKLSKNTKIFTITAASNVLGTMPNVKRYIKKLREVSPDAISIVDGAQYVPHHKINVRELDCDFLAFSGHKMLSSMGIGILYGKEDILNSMPPFLSGGDMIEYVYEDRTSYLYAPQRFEAGTANVGGVVSLSAAIDYIDNIGIESIYEYEKKLCEYAYDKMKDLPYLDLYTTPIKDKSPVIAFNFHDAHPHDVASILDSYKIAVRSGHHCAQPLHRYLGINSSCRATFAFYNTFEEIDTFIEHLEDVRRLMKIES